MSFTNRPVGLWTPLTLWYDSKAVYFSPVSCTGPVFSSVSICGGKTVKCWRSHSEMSPARPHLLFSQPNYGSHPAQKLLYAWRISQTANEIAVCCRLGRKPTNQRSVASEGHAFYAFSGKNVSSCSSLAVSCNRTVLWDGESHVCRCKGKFSTPKLLLWELGQWTWWLFSGIFAEKQTQTNRNSIAA